MCQDGYPKGGGGCVKHDMMPLYIVIYFLVSCHTAVYTLRRPKYTFIRRLVIRPRDYRVTVEVILACPIFLFVSL